MGQYHYIVNLDKREFIHPYGLDIGLKAWEQIANPASTPHALFALLMCSNERGGGTALHYVPMKGPCRTEPWQVPDRK